MKRLAFGLALVVTVVFSACAQHCPESDFRVEMVDGGTAVRIVEYLGENLVVRIPPRIGNLPVTHIGEWAFAGMHWIDEEWVVGHQLTSVAIPNSVTSIGQGAFHHNQLTRVTIPNSVIEIGHSAFAENLLTRVTIPNSVTSIGSGAFHLNQLTSVAIPNSVTSIGDRAFSENQLTNIAIPDSVTNIGGMAFAFNQLTSVAIGIGVTSIWHDTFLGNPPINLTINMANIPSNAFFLTPLASVTIGNSVTSIGNNAFSGISLSIVTIGNNVTSIGDGAFANNQLTNITIPGGVTHIGNRAFWGNQLTNVTIANGVTHIGDMAFSHSGRQFIIPPTMEEDRMIALLDRVPPQYRGRIRAAFRLYDLENLLPSDDRSALLHMFPELNHTNVFALQERPEFLLEQIERLLADAGYTYDEWLADVARFPSTVTIRQNQITSVNIPDSVIRMGDGAFAGNPISDVSIPIDTLIGHSSFDPGVVVTRVPVAPAIHAQQNPELTLVGRWELLDVNVSRNLVANYLEFFGDSAGLLETGNIPGVGRRSESFTWRVDGGRLIITSPMGVAQILSITELSRTTLSYEVNSPPLGNIRATFIRSR